MSKQPNKASVSYTDFGGGEVAPAVYGRVTDDRYITYAKEMKNCRPTRQGSLEGRKGFEELTELPGDTARVFPIEIDGLEDGVIIFRDDAFLQVVADNLGNRVDYVQNASFGNGIEAWSGSGWRKAMLTSQAIGGLTRSVPYTGRVGLAGITAPIPAPNFFVNFNDGRYVNSPLVLRASTRDIDVLGIGGSPAGVIHPETVFSTVDVDKIVGRVSQQVTLPKDGTKVYVDARLICTAISKELETTSQLANAPVYDPFHSLPETLPLLVLRSTTVRNTLPPAMHTSATQGYAYEAPQEVDSWGFSDNAAVVDIGTTEGGYDLGRVRLKDLTPVITPGDPTLIKGVDALSRFARSEGTPADVAIMSVMYPGATPADIAALIGFQMDYLVRVDELLGAPGAPGTTITVWVTIRAWGDSADGEYPRGKAVFASSEYTPGGGKSAGYIRFFEEEIGVKFFSVYSEVPAGGTAGTELASPFPAAALPGLKYALPPESDAMYFTSAGYPPHILAYDRNTATWTFTAANAGNFPAEWTGTSYPGCVAFYQGRSWWGGAEDAPYRIWGSRSGDYLDLVVPVPPTPIVADDPLFYDMATGGVVKWIASKDDLIIGTTIGELALRAQGGILSAATPPRVTIQSNFGSRDVQATLMGNVVIYADASSKKLRAIDFAWDSQSWTSEEVTANAAHLVTTPTDVYYSNNPESTLWWVAGGNINGMTIATERGSVGSFWYDLGGKVLSMGLSSARGAGRLWVVVSRNGKLTVEVEAGHLLDAGQTYIHTTDQDITYSDFVIPERALSLSACLVNGLPGIFSSDANDARVITNVPQGATVVLGRSFEAAWEPLPPVTGGNPVIPVRQARRARIRVYSSAPPYVNGDAPRDQGGAEIGGSPVVSYTGDISVDVENKESILGLVRISQPMPVPFNVSGVFIELQEDQL